MHDYQTTLKSRVTLSGIGVHSGKEVSIHFLPADADTGVVFHMMEGAEPGKEDVILEIAAAYEAASKRRIPPPDFGPL